MRSVPDTIEGKAIRGGDGMMTWQEFKDWIRGETNMILWICVVGLGGVLIAAIVQWVMG